MSLDTIRNPWLLRLFWRRWNVPSYVTAETGLWLRWLLRVPRIIQ